MCNNSFILNNTLCENLPSRPVSTTYLNISRSSKISERLTIKMKLIVTDDVTLIIYVFILCAITGFNKLQYKYK